MTGDRHDDLARLSDEPGSLEQELLRSAASDGPGRGVYDAALAAVLVERRRERAARSRRRWAAAGAVVALAAAMLLLRAPGPEPKVVAEPPVSRSVPVPPPSSSVVPIAPFAPCTPLSIGSGREPMIDDFEDGDTRMPAVDKRAGYWIVFNDGTGKQEPRSGSVFPAHRIPGGRGNSRFGLHSTGGRFTKWGAVLAAELNPRRCYDASAYAGLTFWAKGRATLRISAKMTQVVSEEFGGSCVRDCFDGHGAFRTLTRDWQKFEVRWEELAQRGFGTQVEFDPRSLYSVEVQMPQGQPPFDVWIDDVAFIER